MHDFGNIRDKDSLIAAMHGGAAPKWLFFWGHQPPGDGSVSKSCFSQWWPAAFEIDGARYPTAEHFMMAEKARLFGDEATRQEILTAKHPRQAKMLGRKIAGFEESRWNEARFGIVVRGNLAKFGQHADLRQFLLGTGQRVLVEASPVDSIWGIGLAADDPLASQPASWPGLNLLGFALMEVRAVLDGQTNAGGKST
jgi:ribA/ribD-fused uncharacterized protein